MTPMLIAAALRVTLDLSAIASGAAYDVHGNLGLAGATVGGAFPRAWAPLSSVSYCLSSRPASYVGWGSSDGEIAEVVTINGHEYLDESRVVVENDVLKTDSHTRRAITRVATLGETTIWAYRDSGALSIGTFAEFSSFGGAFSLGCRWLAVTVSEHGGSANIFSSPIALDIKSWGITPPPPEPPRASFSALLSLSRSTTDPAPLVLLRLATLRE